MCCSVFLFSIRRRHTGCALVTGVQTCALPLFLSGNYHSVRAGLHPQRALRIALSMYNTGSQSRGFSNGYVGRVVGNAGVSDGIQPAAVRIGEPMPATDTSAGSSAAAQLAA